MMKVQVTPPEKTLFPFVTLGFKPPLVGEGDKPPGDSP